MEFTQLYLIDNEEDDLTTKFKGLISEQSIIVDKPESPQELPTFEKEEVIFNTGSSYIGEWNQLGMEGNSTYKLQTGNVYEGSMKDGMFHGEGTLRFRDSTEIKGVWENGKLDTYDLYYPDKECEKKNYCKMPDRRFYTEIRDGFNPECQSRTTNVYPARTIPDGFYDAGDGFYNPKNKCIVDADNIQKIIRIPTRKEVEWIVNNCRKPKDEHVGYRPELYENNFEMPDAEKEPEFVITNIMY